MVFNKTKKLITEFKDDINGNFGVLAATTILGLISAVGLSVDGQRVYTHSAKTQSVADAAGLAAAIHASSNDGMVPTTGAAGVFIEGQTYSATELGFELGTGESITFEVDYDEIAREVTVTTTGTVTPLMLQLIGKSEITTSASSTVKFQEPDNLKPASVLFVLDESGSMWFDDIPTLDGTKPQNAVRRIDALRKNMNDLNGRLRSLGSDTQTAPDDLFLRTGVVTYNNGPIPRINQFGQQFFTDEQGPAGPLKLIIPMDWRSISESDVNTRLSPFGGTNSGPALQRAKTIMDAEKTIHEKDENGESIAERYVIFMSDGNNDFIDGVTQPIWRAQSDTGFYRRFVNVRVCTRRNFWGRCIRVGIVRREQTWDIDTAGAPPPDGQGWTEGVYGSQVDADTVNECTALKNDGVNIYTIGFALQEGHYFTNDWNNGTVPGGGTDQPTSEATRAKVRRAVSLLRACATDDSTFLLANDAAQLEIAFDQIGIAITEDIIRLTN